MEENCEIPLTFANGKTIASRHLAATTQANQSDQLLNYQSSPRRSAAKRERYMAEEKAKPSERTDSSLQHMWLFGTLLSTFSFLKPWNLSLARLFARRSGGDAVRSGARSWMEPSERSGKPWTNLKRYFPNTYHLIQTHGLTSATGQSANANTP